MPFVPWACFSCVRLFAVDHVLGSLIAARLVRPVPTNVGEQRVELAHAALVWNWPRMVEWLNEERIATRRRVRLTTAAEQWRAHGKDPGGLLGGSPRFDRVNLSSLGSVNSSEVL